MDPQRTQGRYQYLVVLGGGNISGKRRSFPFVLGFRCRMLIHNFSKFLASDGHIIVWCLRSGSLFHCLRPKQGPIVVVQWLREPKSSQTFWFLSAGANGTLIVWKFDVGTVSIAIFESVKCSELAPCKHTFEWIHMETVFSGAIEHIEVDDA